MKAQGELDNWYTWRIVLGDGLGFVEVPIRMASNSTANPVFTTFLNSSERVAVSTFFIPSEGSGPDQAGELLHIFPLP